jgi:orotidine-5'-phosphate decarboxylase
VTAGPIIVALDFPQPSAALELAARLDPARCRVKVGKELFVRAGPAVVESLQGQGFQVFLDLKFHDIPNTVAGACRAAADLGVWMVDVHAGGGRAMMEAAREAVDRARHRPLLIAVTLLTSMGAEDLAEIGLAGSTDEAVIRLARLTESSGLDGVVCSATDLTAMSGAVSGAFLRVTPGIRPAGVDAGDQRRVATPGGALADGATHLVIGRAITQAAEPLAALAAIEAEIAATHG